MHMQMEQEMKKRKDIFMGLLCFRREMGGKQDLRVEKKGTRHVQSRWNICLVFVLWSMFKCAENIER